MKRCYSRETNFVAVGAPQSQQNDRFVGNQFLEYKQFLCVVARVFNSKGSAVTRVATKIGKRLPALVLMAFAGAGLHADPSMADTGQVYLSGGNSGSGGGGSSGSGSSGSGSGGGGSGSGSWGSGSGSSGSSGSDSWGSGSSGRGSDDTYRGSGDFESANRGSGNRGSSDDGSGSSRRGRDSSDSDSDSSNRGSGSSGNDPRGYRGDDAFAWRTLAAREMPEFDRRGFPTRRGEVIALDMAQPQIEAARKLGFSIVDKSKLSALGAVMLRLRAPKDMSATQALTRLRAISPGTFFELDHYFGVTGGGLDAAHGTDMVDMKIPDKKKLWIGMIDTAVWNQATLRGARIDSHDFANKAGRPPFAHGTAVASILHRQGAARITSANVFKAGGHPYSSAEAIARAVNWMVERKVPVINISIAGPQNALVDRVVADAKARGHLIVAAVGNAGPTAPPAYPAASPGAIAVTAIDRQGRIYVNANRGKHVEISAIGVGVGAEAPDGALKPHSGTSFAAPFVSISLARCHDKVNPQQADTCVNKMEARAVDLGPKGRDPIYGHGMLVP